MHLRVPSGTSMPLSGASNCACKGNVAGARNVKTAASVVRWRRVFMCVLIEMAREGGLREVRSDAILEFLPPNVEDSFE